MNASMFYIGGSKGGVGKSKVSFALIDYLISNGHKVLLLESDTANPDVYKAHLRHANEGLRGAPQKSDRCDSYSTRRGEHTCPSERIMPRLSRPEWP